MRQRKGQLVARLTQQDKAATRERILRSLESIGNATEAELSEALGIDRRTVNNYLRDALASGEASKDGLVWSIQASKVVRLIDQLIISLQELRTELHRGSLGKP